MEIRETSRKVKLFLLLFWGGPFNVKNVALNRIPSLGVEKLRTSGQIRIESRPPKGDPFAADGSLVFMFGPPRGAQIALPKLFSAL